MKAVKAIGIVHSTLARRFLHCLSMQFITYIALISIFKSAHERLVIIDYESSEGYWYST